LLKNIISVLFLIILFSCAHKNPKHVQKNKTSNKQIIVNDAAVSSILSAPTKEEASQSVVEKLLDESEGDQELDDNNRVDSMDRTYTEEDRAEDVIDKLLQENAKAAQEANEEIEKNFITVKNHPLVHKWIRFFTQTDRQRFIRFMQNGAKYRDAIEKIFEEEGVPKGLFFVGVIESGFFLKARSHADAVGPWQFIRATGKRYGLTVSRTLDERKDLYKSTRAAARYFRDLYKIFGSWELAMSAYNAGEYGIMRRMKRAQSESFFNMANRGFLLPETANYVPKVMATLHIYQNLDRYGFEDIKADNPFESAVQVKLKHSHSLRYIANTLDMSLETLQNLNTELPTPYTPYVSNGYYELRIPKNAWLERGSDLISALSNKTTRTPLLTLKRYDRQSTTANSKVKSPSRALRFSRENKDKSIIRTNQPLFYTIRTGDNLTQIAKQFRTTPDTLKNFNKLNNSQVMKGQKIRIPKKVRTYYQVKRGDNLYSIAKRFNLSATFIKQLNDLSAPDLYAGQKILIPL
jgi:membrane-bound lytic murein transglycosylase D